MLPMVHPMNTIPMTARQRDYDKPEHFVHITLDADENAKSDRATVKAEGNRQSLRSSYRVTVFQLEMLPLFFVVYITDKMAIPS